MTSRRRFVLRAAFAIALIATAFGCGWLAYGHHHSETRAFGYTVAAPFRAPRGFKPIGLPFTPSTAHFSAGDRVDLLIVIDGKPEPLILDALVTGNTKPNFGLLVQYGDSEIFLHVRQLGHEIVFRPSIVPWEAEYTSDFLQAQEELKRLRADGRGERKPRMAN